MTDSNAGYDGAVEPWLADPAAMLASVRTDLDGVAATLASHSGTTPLRRSALFHPDAIAAALLADDGSVIVASPLFANEAAERHIDFDVATRAATAVDPQIVTVEIDNGTGAPIPAIFVYASLSLAQDWRLPAGFAEKIARQQGAVVVVTTLSSVRTSPLEAACRAFGLNGLQSRVAIATVKLGSIKHAARSLGISYQTARDATAEAMKRAGVHRLPALVTRLASLSFGVLPDGVADAAMLTDLWSITERQSTLATLIADGLTRSEAARSLGLSEAVAKKELDRLYVSLNVSSAAQLARLMIETQALQWVTQATGGRIGFIEHDREPLRFVLRPDGTRVAWSDYGPAGARPVLVVHSSVTSRFVSRRLLRALQARGFRPLAIDRPGFGLTDPLPGLVAGRHDPFVSAVDDVALVAAQARIARLDVIARGAARHLLALQRARPELLGRVVLTNPEPETPGDRRRHGAVGAVKELYVRRPALIRLMARALAGQLSHEKMPRLLAKMMEGSPPDEAAIAESDIFEDYFRSLRHFATGRFEGYVNEQTAHAVHDKLDPLEGPVDWQIIVGEHDTLYDPDTVIADWRRLVPGAGWQKLAGAGRLLTMTHPEAVVDLLSAPTTV